MKKSHAGFTLVEILIVVAVVGILSAVLYANFSDAREKARDAKRKTDLKTLQAAIELYKNDHGRYPAGCNAPTINFSATNNWSGQPGSGAGYECPAGTPYIIDLAPKYIPVLPTDPKLNGVGSGYMYTTNPTGTVYKLIVMNTVESEQVRYDVNPPHPYVRCGKVTAAVSECSSIPSSAGGPYPGYNTGYGSQNNCRPPEIYNDYAVSGGYADAATEKAMEYYTDIIRCK